MALSDMGFDKETDQAAESEAIAPPHWHCVECDGSKVSRFMKDGNVYCDRCWTRTWKINEALPCNRPGCTGTWPGIGKDE